MKYYPAPYQLNNRRRGPREKESVRSGIAAGAEEIKEIPGRGDQLLPYSAQVNQFNRNGGDDH